jgi:predicted nuclease with TOPRIM domain
MDNQHKKIKGYRDLNQQEIDLMNRIKEKAEEVGELVNELEVVRATNMENSESFTTQDVEAARCLSIAKGKLQTGFMWFVRAVALPESF